MQTDDKKSRNDLGSQEYGQPLQIKEDISVNIKALSSRGSQSNSVDVSAISPTALGLMSSQSNAKAYGPSSQETSAK